MQKTILITGANGTLGQILSQGFSKKGFQLILLGRNIKALEKLYDELEAARLHHPSNGQAFIYPFDLTQGSLNDYQTLHTTLAQKFGHLEGLIHTAAQLGTLTPIEHYPPDQWLKIVHLNLNSVFLLTQTMLPLLKKAPQAHLFFTNCEEGQNPKAYWGAYSVAKSGLETLAHILKEECSAHTNIGVHTINPGIMPSRLRQQAYPAEKRLQTFNPEGIFEHYWSIYKSKDGVC